MVFTEGPFHQRKIEVKGMLLDSLKRYASELEQTEPSHAIAMSLIDIASLFEFFSNVDSGEELDEIVERLNG